MVRTMAWSRSTEEMVWPAGEVCGERHCRSILWVFRRIVDERTRVAGGVADWIECIHDLCMVWAPEVQRSRPVEGHYGELGNCVLRVLPAGAGEPARLANVLTRPTEGDSGGHYADCVWSVLRLLLRRQAA